MNRSHRRAGSATSDIQPLCRLATELRLATIGLAAMAFFHCKSDAVPSPKNTTPQPAPAAPAPIPAKQEPAARVAPPPLTPPSQENKGSATCEAICKLSAPLRCTGAKDCIPDCQSMASSPLCRGEIDRFFACLLQQPTRNWECDEGVAAVREPYCHQEQARLAGCLESAAQP